jgi:hypothetical protein
MRTKNERILLAILIAIVFVSGNYYGYRWLAKNQADLESSYMDLKGDNLQAQIDLQKQDLWAKRKAWLDAHQPALGVEDDAKAQVLEYVTKGAHDNKLEILEQSLNDSQSDSSGTRVYVAVKVKGSMQSLVDWLADLQKPVNFYAVTQFSLKADQDAKSFICTLQLARYFKGGS